MQYEIERLNKNIIDLTEQDIKGLTHKELTDVYNAIKSSPFQPSFSTYKNRIEEEVHYREKQLRKCLAYYTGTGTDEY